MSLSVFLLLDSVELGPYLDFRHNGTLSHVDDVPDALGGILRNEVAAVIFFCRSFEVLPSKHHIRHRVC